MRGRHPLRTEVYVQVEEVEGKGRWDKLWGLMMVRISSEATSWAI